MGEYKQQLSMHARLNNGSMCIYAILDEGGKNTGVSRVSKRQGRDVTNHLVAGEEELDLDGKTHAQAFKWIKEHAEV